MLRYPVYNIDTRTEKNSLEIMRTTTERDLVFSIFQTVSDTRETLKTIVSTVMAPTSGQMETGTVFTKASYTNF